MAGPPGQFVGRMTREEYLAFEELSEIKHEYHDGKVYSTDDRTMQMPEPALTPVGRMTRLEYAEFQETAEVKHEYHAGEVLAMSGGTFEHSSVIRNLNGMMYNRLREKPCTFMESNMRVRSLEFDKDVFPDGTIYCGEPEFFALEKKHLTLMNPRVVFEVLSDSTEGYDRGKKFTFYGTIPTLEEVILIAQDRVEVVSLLRSDDGNWSMQTWLDPAETAQVRCLPLELPIADLYEGVTFDDA
ncbi:MAG: Uma2 family endonuclease [Planctomycetota bacterium]